MDRDSLRGLRAQTGYSPFVAAATLARVSDEMFAVGAVLLVLERTGTGTPPLPHRSSRGGAPAEAGLKVGAFSLGAALAGPVATGLGSATALAIAAGVQFTAAAVGAALWRLPARPLPAQVSPGG